MEERRVDFFLTNPSYEARPVVFKYQAERSTALGPDYDVAEAERSSNVNRSVTVTLHISHSESYRAPFLAPVE